MELSSKFLKSKQFLEEKLYAFTYIRVKNYFKKFYFLKSQPFNSFLIKLFYYICVFAYTHDIFSTLIVWLTQGVGLYAGRLIREYIR